MLILIIMFASCHSKSRSSNPLSGDSTNSKHSESSIIRNYTFKIDDMSYQNQRLYIKLNKYERYNLISSKVYSSIDEGINWQELDLNEIPKLSIYSFQYPKSSESNSPDAIAIIDSLNAWIINYNKFYDIYRTTDGGKTYIIFNYHPQMSGIITMDAYDSSSVFIIGRSNDYSCEWNYCYSNDGANTWISNTFYYMKSMSSSHDIKLKYFPPKTAFLYDNYEMYRTIDGGNNWSPILTKSEYDDTIKIFSLKNEKIIFYAYGNSLYKSIDSGSNWTILRNDFSDYSFTYE